MKINKSTIEKYFTVEDVILSGGRRSSYKLTTILEDLVRIQPTEARTASRLKYNKLEVVINNFDDINPKQIEFTVGGLLGEHGLQDTQNESYLYGFAKEFLRRSNIKTIDDFNIDLQSEISKSLQDTTINRKNRLKNSNKKPNKLSVSTVAYQRNADVIVEVLMRANGVCESCRNKAPFKRASDGSPYLEVHHIIPLSQSGDDSVDNAIAVCPNCHRKAHFGTNA